MQFSLKTTTIHTPMKSVSLNLTVAGSLAGASLIAFAAVAHANLVVPATLVAADSVVVHLGTGSPAANVGYHQNSEDNLVGNEGTASSLRSGNVVIGFQLPHLTAEITNVTLTLRKFNASPSGGFDWTAQLYAFAPGLSPRDIGAVDHASLHYRGTEVDTGPSVRLLTANALQFSTPNSTLSGGNPAVDNPVPIDLTSHFQEGGTLADFYADGAPTSLGGMIWFRLSPGTETNAVERFRIHNFLDHAYATTLEFTVIPEPRTYALLGGLAILGLALVRRRLGSGSR
jgi:hypothetical protein